MSRRRAVFLLVAAALALSSATGLSAEGPEHEWPREIITDAAVVLVYQPQFDSLDGDLLKGRAAVSVQMTGADEPLFGAAWLESRIDTDADTRMVSFRDLTVPRVRFPDATEEQEQQLARLMTAEMPGWDLDTSLDRMMAALEVAERKSSTAEGFNDAPPVILFSQEPKVLVAIDGEPQLRDLEDSGMQYVVNAPFIIVTDPNDKNRFYLYAGAKTWYSAPAVEGPWTVSGTVPDQVRQLEPKEEEIDPELAAEGPSTPPGIVVSTEPTELIVTTGAPEYTPVADGQLLVVSNSESDVLIEVATQQKYVLLSGRWFTSKSLDGPWQLIASDELPESFSEIDPDSDQGYLLTWVAGTEMAEEAVLDSYVPQTAAVKLDATIDVTYDGEPKFEPVEETELTYGVNTASQVLKYKNLYYCAEQGIWYVAASAKGPWQVATSVPEEIYKIPPDNPNYNVTYVEVFESTPEVVYVGYYPGYVHSYHYHGCLVFGTGWIYRPWWGPRIYYPRFRTWGFHVRWNPWHGWGFGFGFSTGRFTFGVGFGGWHRRGWWGPAGFRGYRRGYARGWHHGYRSGARAGYRAGYRSAQNNQARNMYQNKGNAGKVANTGGGRGDRTPGGGKGDRTPGGGSSRPNNVYTDKSGNVYRQQSDGKWQQRDGGQWKNADVGDRQRPSGGDAGKKTPQAGTTDRTRPSGGDTGKKPSTGSYNRDGSTSKSPYSGSGNQRSGSYGSSGSSLNRDSYARSRGSQRSNSYSRSGGGSRGGSRGGGGRRR